jgi:hypothetical protein
VDNAPTAGKDTTIKTASTTSSSEKKAPMQGPQPIKAVGIARPTSAIARKAAEIKNRPFTPAPITAGTAPRMARNTKKARGIGPVPEGVWYAAKGSAMSRSAAKRANKPSS